MVQDQLSIKEVITALQAWKKYSNKKTRAKVPVLHRGILGEVYDYNLIERYKNVMPTMRKELNIEIIDCFLKGTPPEKIPETIKTKIGDSPVSYMYVANTLIGTKEVPGFARFCRDEIRRRSGYCPFCEPIRRGSPQAYTPKVTSNYCPRCNQVKLRREIWKKEIL